MNRTDYFTEPRPLSPICPMLPEGKDWFTAKEAAGVIGRSAQYVRDCFDNQKIMGHALNARGRSGEEQRKSYQIPRASLMLYMLETANYQPGDFSERVSELLDQLTPSERKAIIEKTNRPRTSIWEKR